MRTIGLCMIVKDEAEVIERCLEAVKPLISSWVICAISSFIRRLSRVAILHQADKEPANADILTALETQVVTLMFRQFGAQR